VDSLRELARDFVPSENTYVVPNVNDALLKARSLAGNEGMVCVTGSLYLLGDVSAAAELTKQAVS
jgi:folylpolyglutamate synthase/dihydropteroate synthase